MDRFDDDNGMAGVDPEFEKWIFDLNELCINLMATTIDEFDESYPLHEWYSMGLSPDVAAENLYNDWLKADPTIYD